MDLLLTCMLIFAGINVYKVLYKENKYKVMLIVAFYAISITTLICAILSVGT
jgi:hypothetical protein